MREPLNGNGRLLARIDERTKAIRHELKQLREDMGEHEKTARETYVTRDEFKPIRNVIYGLIGLTLSSVASAVLLVVLR